MVFSSISFVFAFLPVVLSLYCLSPKTLRNHVALAASCLFYAWGAPRFVFVLLGSCLIDYGISRMMGPVGANRPLVRRRLLILAVALNLAVFLYFKYANFFVGEWNGILARLGRGGVAWTEVALPIGISFFTFQKLSYLVDVYRGIVRPAGSAATYTLYVALFPQLIAGPIVRYHDIVEQLTAREHTGEKMLSGIGRFCRGLARKVLIANVMGEVADRAFALGGEELGPANAWIGAVCYSFQIYFDFAGYSDMAIGLGRLLGFEFPENFDKPYTARGFMEFWRRWHISLSAWMREYLYIPLGGNRAGSGRTYVNLWIVFLLSGLWHGAAWTFVAWGAFHGLFMCLERMIGRERMRRIPDAIAVSATFALVTIGWVLFRADTLADALAYMVRMFSFFADAPPRPLLDAHSATILALAALCCFAPAFARRFRSPAEWLSKASGAVPALTFVSGMLWLLLSVCALAAERFNPFIYFRF